LAGDKLSKFDKWVAQWPTQGGVQRGLDISPDERSGWSIWQFTSEGEFAGYGGYLDTNYAYHDFPNPGKPNPGPAPAPEPTPAPAPAPQKYNVGDSVIINGDLYTSSDADSPAGKVSNKITTITRYAAGAKHPYNTTGDLGWMNESDISPAPETPELHKWDRVKFTGTKSYSGIPLASWTHGSIFDVIEVSGNRVVIGKGSAVTAAVNIKDCQKV
jgi:hypothetical protein